MCAPSRQAARADALTVVDQFDLLEVCARPDVHLAAVVVYGLQYDLLLARLAPSCCSGGLPGAGLGAATAARGGVDDRRGAVAGGRGQGIRLGKRS